MSVYLNFHKQKNETLLSKRNKGRTFILFFFNFKLGSRQMSNINLIELISFKNFNEIRDSGLFSRSGKSLIKIFSSAANQPEVNSILD